MFKNTSKAGVGLWITILTLIIQMFGLDISDQQVIEVVHAAAQVVGFVLLVWGQLDRTDLTFFGLMRKESRE